MEFWYVLGGAVLTLILFPYVRFGVRRIRFAVKMRKACRDNGFTFRPAHPLWLFDPNNCGRASFYAVSESDSRLYAVSLFGALHRLETLTFIDGKRYRWERAIPVIGRGVVQDDGGSLLGAVIHRHETRIRKLQPVDYYFRLPDTVSSGRTVLPVVIGNPVPLHVMRAREVWTEHSTVERLAIGEKKKETRLDSREIYDGDLIFDAYLFSGEGFRRELYHSCLAPESVWKR